MYCIFWIAFGICFAINLLKSGDGYILFYRYVTFMNKLKDPPIKFAFDRGESLLTEYHYGRRIYGVTIGKYPPSAWNEWVQVAVFKKPEINPQAGEISAQKVAEISGPLVKTGKIEYYAGPFKNFHNKRDTPSDINRKYVKLAFMYADNSVIHVNQGEIIIDKLMAVRRKYDKVE